MQNLADVISVAPRFGGGTANGGVDCSAVRTFSIDIALYHPPHNRVKATDVTGAGHTVAEDALDIINYINAHGAGPVDTSHSSGSQPLTAGTTTKIFYLDVTNDDNISPTTCSPSSITSTPTLAWKPKPPRTLPSRMTLSYSSLLPISPLNSTAANKVQRPRLNSQL
jgi:hypothetical protein